MTQIPAAWYPDPAGSGQQRYWNGAAWTTHLRAPEAVATPQWPAPFEPLGVYGASPTITPRLRTDIGESYTRQASPRFFGWVLVLFGIISLLAGFGSLVPAILTATLFGGTSSAGAGAVETTGQVIDLQAVGTECTPIAAFVVDGETYTAVSSVTYAPCNTALGRDVKVSYVPGNINGTAIVPDDPTLTNTVSGMFGLGGAVFSGVGTLLLFVGIYLVKANPKATAGPLLS